MSTRLEWTKTGLKLVIEQDKRVLPSPGRAFPLPAFGVETHALITSALEWQASTGRYGIRVTSIDAAGLPGKNDGGGWSLMHCAYVGAAPAVLPWERLALGTVTAINTLLANPMPNATHRFFLRKEGVPNALGVRPATVDYPECAPITTPDDRGIGTDAVAQVNLRSPNTDNLIPNPTSEGGAVAGLEGTLVIFDPGNAFAGSNCRRLNTDATNETALTIPLPCFYGDQFSFDAQAKVSNAAAGVAILVKFFDGAGSLVGTSVGSTVTGTSYGQTYVQGAAPAGTQTMQAFVKTVTTLAGGFGYFDNLSLRRSVKPAHMESDAGFRVLNALKNSGTTTNDRTWYAGNDDPATRGGAANISCLTITRRRWDTTNKIGRLELSLQPSAASDNLDGMRMVKVEWLRQSAAGTSGTLTAIDTTWEMIPDRLFQSTTDSNTANAALFTARLNDALISSGFPACKVTLYNAFGPSDTHCFYAAAANADGSVLTDNGTAWPAGLSGSGGGSYGGGGGGGGTCPAPWVMIDLPAGAQKAAGELEPGELVWTHHATGTVGAWPVLAVSLEEGSRWDLWLEGLPEPKTFAPTHRFRTPQGWTELQDLVPGQMILGDRPRQVLGAAFRDIGPLVRITVDQAHSYQTDGLLSSNVKILN